MIKEIFARENFQLPCWIPVFIAIGILISLRIAPLNNWLILAAIICLTLIRFLNHNIIFIVITTSIASILIGILSMQLRVANVDSPKIEATEQYYKIWGNIDNITPQEKGNRVILSKLFIARVAKEKTPYKIRLTVRTNLNGAKIGDRVKIVAILSKPMEPYLEDSYNFARDAYFKQIGAVGYSVSSFEVLKSDKKSWKAKLNSLRNNIQTRVNNSIGSYYGSIATALMINEYSNIDKDILKNLRYSGLAHILSVSGMHLSLAAAIFFFTSRFLINCFHPLALRVNSKKIAAFISLLGTLAYLLISGMEVAAIRSFIMTSMVIIAIIIDRTSSPMRAIAISACIILIMTPENIIHPSFQMSFAAVIALIACFELFTKLQFNFAEFNLLQKMSFYLLSVCFTSLIAGLATAPFSLYHFSNSANYSILANLLAVPITSFWLMPLVIATFILYPFHLEHISLFLMKYGIMLMLKIASFIANIPHSVTSIAKISDGNLLIIVFGMLWFCLFTSRIRLAGFAMIFLAIISQNFARKTDIFVDPTTKTIAFVDEKNRLIFLQNPLKKFKKQLLMNHLGTKQALYSQKNCQNEICILHKDNYQLKFNLSNLEIVINKDNINYPVKIIKDKTNLITLKSYGN